MCSRFFSALAIGVCVLFAGQVADAQPPDGLDEPIRMKASEFPSDERLIAMESGTRIFIRLISDEDEDDTDDEDPTNPGGDPDPTDPGDDEDPTDPGDDEDPTDPGDDEDPTDPGDDEDPTDPGDDEDPTDPGDDEDPTDPGDDEDPTDPGNDAPAPPVNDGNLHVGMNVAWFNYYTPQWWNVDVARWLELRSGNVYSPWLSSGRRELDLGDDGYPRGLVSLSGDVQSASGNGTELTINSNNHRLQVNDVVRFEGLKSGGAHEARVVGVSSNSFRVRPGLSSHTNGGTWSYQQKASGLTLRSIQGRYPTGDYTLKFEGEGAVELRYGTPDRRYSHDGDGEAEFTVPVSASDAGIEVNIVSSNPDNHVRNLRLFMPGFDDGDDYHPLFLERLEPFRGAIRFMDANNTNNSNVVRWEDRTPEDWPWFGGGGILRTEEGTATRLAPGSSSGSFWGNWGSVARVTSPNHGLITGQMIRFQVPDVIWARESVVRVIDENTFDVRTQAEVGSTISGNWDWTLEIRSGYPYEKMVEMCNRTRSHMWVTVPLLADDDYMRNLAQLIRDQLDDDLIVYLELSNEHWNSIFSQYNIVVGWGQRDGVSMHEAYANRAQDLFRIFYDEFAGQEDRLVRTIGTQRVSAWRSEQILQHLDGEFDALAITTYFSGVSNNLPSDSTGGDLAQRALNHVSSDEWLQEVQAQADVVDRYSEQLGRDIRLLAYEGGQHVSANGRDSSYEQAYYDAQRHPTMGEAYRTMLDRFESVGGDLLVAFNYVAIDSKHGSWGHLRYQDSDPDDHPKYNVLVDHINEVLGTDY